MHTAARTTLAEGIGPSVCAAGHSLAVAVSSLGGIIVIVSCIPYCTARNTPVLEEVEAVREFLVGFPYCTPHSCNVQSPACHRNVLAHPRHGRET